MDGLAVGKLRKSDLCYRATAHGSRQTRVVDHRPTTHIDAVMGIAAPGRHEMCAKGRLLHGGPALTDLSWTGRSATTPAHFALAQMRHRSRPRSDNPPNRGGRNLVHGGPSVLNEAAN